MTAEGPLLVTLRSSFRRSGWRYRWNSEQGEKINQVIDEECFDKENVITVMIQHSM